MMMPSREEFKVLASMQTQKVFLSWLEASRQKALQDSLTKDETLSRWRQGAAIELGELLRYIAEAKGIYESYAE